MKIYSTCVVSLLCPLTVCLPADGPLRLDFSPPPLERVLSRLETKTLECPRCDTRPEIDGQLGDSAWRDAKVIENLSNVPPRTRVRICHDERRLYIGIECAELPGRTPEAKAKERDGVIWQDDRVEIWIDTNPRDGSQQRFVVNVIGAVFDGIQRGAARLSDWNPEWSHAVTRDDRGWTVELAIPYKSLALEGWPPARRGGRGGTVPGKLAFNVGREGPAVNPAAWAAPYNDTSRSFLLFRAQAGEDVQEDAAEPSGKEPESATAGDSLRVTFERAWLRPGDRWLEGEIQVRPKGVALDKTRVRARLFALGDPQPIAETSVVPSRHAGRLMADLRSQGLRDARVSVELFEAEQRTGVAEHFLASRPCETPLENGQRIPVRLDLPEGIDSVEAWPVTFGVPFHAGALWDARTLRVVDGTGRELPAQKEVVATWTPEGAVKWVRFDALVSAKDGCAVEVAAEGVRAAPQTPVRVARQDGKVVVETGVARYVLAKGISPIEEIWLGGKRIATAAGTRGLYVIDQRDRAASASADGETMEIEASGPVAACVRFEGFYRTSEGEQIARHVTRIEAFAGQPIANITHTLVLTNDTNKVWLKDVGWELAVDAGTGPEATFALSRPDWQKSLGLPLDGAQTTHMLQDQHYRFRQGKNHFLVAAGTGGKYETKAEGEECGDWAALAGAMGGVVLSCREAARQHPKEFEVGRRHIVLHLFSNRTGEELDFRTESLIKRWDLRGWYSRVLGAKPAKVEEYLAKVTAYQSNAIGWAKTHQIMIAPLPPRADPLHVARMCRLHSRPVHAVADPSWICSTKAIAAIHPRDPERFPVHEKVIERNVEREIAALENWGDLGFVDYFAGPHYQTGNTRRYGLTYTLRGDLWLAYVRSGDRKIREFIGASDRSYIDNYFSHWDGEGRIRGLLHAAGGDSWQGYGKGALPFYWEGEARMETSSTTNLNNFIWLYYLTGYRRAKDHLLEYADGIKRFWTPARAGQAWRSLMVMRCLIQAYGFTWDRELKAMADSTTDQFADAEGEILLSKNRPYRSSTYKTGVDVRALLDAWEIAGSKRYHGLALRVSQFWWDHMLGQWPLTYTNPQGRVGSFLYNETGELRYAQGLAVQLRQIATLYDPETDQAGGYGRSAGTFVYEGISHAQDVVARSGADNQTLASWVGYEDFDYPTSIVVQKADEAIVRVDVRGKPKGAGAVGGMGIRPILLGRASGQEFNRLVQSSNGVARVRIPKDSAPGAYEIIPPAGGRFFAMAHSKVPFVLHAPMYWKPQPKSAPAYQWYFRLPEDSRDAQILFEGSGRLFDPDGQPFGGDEPLRGWIDLPADKPGLWSFQPVLNQLVRVRNVAPFFSTDPDTHFVPEIPWQREDIPPAPKEIPPETVYVPGAIEKPKDQALYLVGKRHFDLEAGPEHPSGKGGRFLPHEQGTIEFWMKPTWSTFDLPPKIAKPILRMESTETPWSLAYHKRPNPSYRYRSHCLYAAFYMEGPTKRLRTPAYLQTIFERDKWAHLAWVWGLREMPTHRGRKALLCTQLFVNGQPGRPYEFLREEPPNDRPTAFRIGPLIDAAIDELRISDVQRYTEPFRPPARETEFRLDEHTRALFHFNGDVKGQSYGYAEGAPATVGTK